MIYFLIYKNLTLFFMYYILMHVDQISMFSFLIQHTRNNDSSNTIYKFYYTKYKYNLNTIQVKVFVHL